MAGVKRSNWTGPPAARFSRSHVCAHSAFLSPISKRLKHTVKYTHLENLKKKIL